MSIQTNKIRLSILICTIPGREDKLHRLEEILRPQQNEETELIIHDDLAHANGGPTIGTNRNAMLDACCGDYIAFIDDDDVVSDKYVELILDAIKDNPDCVGIKGHYTVGDGKPELFIHSIQYNDWFTKDGVHYRCPNHLNPVKRELALQAKFTEKNNGEDYDYSLALRPLLKTEKMIDEVVYFYRK